MTRDARRALATLLRLARTYGGGVANEKRACLEVLERADLATPEDVRALHEALCWLRALPDDAALRAGVERLLAGFARRPDLRRHRAALADTGIAGTTIHFPFDAATARWLVRRWPDRLGIEWSRVPDKRRLMDRIYLLSLDAETPGLDNARLTPRQWIRRMKRPDETQAEFLVRRFARVRFDPTVRDVLQDELALPFVLRPGSGTPARTHALAPLGPRAWRTRPPSRERPDLRRALAEPPRAIRSVAPRQARALIDLTLAAMVTRHRALDAFADASKDDVRLVDCGDGLAFAVIGIRPPARMMLEAVYGWLTLRNRVPVGYVLTSAFLGSSEVAFNTFDTWRGADAAWVYGRVLAATRALFGSDTFSVFPYQLGHRNPEGLASGAWWFYRKLGFAPRDPATLALARREEARIRKDPGHRSDRATLRRLARVPVFYATGRARTDVMGQLRLERVGLAVTDLLGRRFGSDKGRAERVLAAEAARRLGARDWRAWPRDERRTWLRWAPLLAVLDERVPGGLGAWSARERRALVRLVRAKGGRRETDYVRRLADHPRLCRLLRELAR